MNFGDKIKAQKYQEIWDEYCGFLDLNIEEYMHIQNRLMNEQMNLWCNSKIGKKILGAASPRNIDEFRSMVPLTTYFDYADILLNKKGDMLPSEPVIWLQTTWEGGSHPIKIAPYSKEMLEVFQNNMMSVSTICSSGDNKKTRLKNGDRVLFGLAPLPFVTGLFPLVFKEEIDFNFLPPVSLANSMSFSQRNKLGFSMGFQQGIDVFFGMSSVIYYVTQNFDDMLKSKGDSSRLSTVSKMYPKMIYRYLKAKYISKKEERKIFPKDIFSLKCLVCAGTDTSSYKDSLKEAWGIIPHEIFAGTEISMMGTETGSHNGQVFFPDTCFYEFIPQDEMERWIDDNNYVPKTVLMDELVENESYEIVVTVLKGGAFARYRVGDVFRCISTKGDHTTSLPRLVFVDRVPWVIDIAGFTRITENSVRQVMELSGLAISHWIAKKEWDEERRPYLHLYVEMDKTRLHTIAISTALLREHLETYFTYFDSDYRDLRKMLGIEPLKITILKTDTINRYNEKAQKPIRNFNPSTYALNELLKINASVEVTGRSVR